MGQDGTGGCSLNTADASCKALNLKLVKQEYSLPQIPHWKGQSR